MENTYHQIERIFEKVTSVIANILGSSVTFIVTFFTVFYWFANKQFYQQDIHQCIGDVILGIAFLSLFAIQKNFDRFASSLHSKVNELVASHKTANNSVINIEDKIEYEIIELSKEYLELAEFARKLVAIL
ncbi:MAG: low affinity iron permease family protein [Chitinophagaceae bacterium]